MDRRKAIQNMALILGGAILLPKGVSAMGRNAVVLQNLQLTPDQQTTIGWVCETIIPATQTPGARELQIDKFVILMVDDCYSAKDQNAFMTGLGQIDDASKKQFGKAFNSCTKQERESVLLTLNGKNDYSPELNTFYRILRNKTIQGYTESQFFMTKEIVYELIPGRYNAHFPVKA